MTDSSETETLGGDTGTATASGTTAGTGPQTATEAGTATGTGTETDPATSTGAATDAATETGGETESGGLPRGHKLLQNDSWQPTEGLSFQLWGSPEDCWASVFDVAAMDQPYDVVAVRVAIGGAGDTKSFKVAIWSVDNKNKPMAEIDSAIVDIQGDVGIEEIDLAVEGLVIPTFQNGNFAAVMCHVDHMGSPSIITDADGNVDADNNWVFKKIDGNWVQAPSFGGIAGDFIFRAIIDVMP